MAANRSRAAVLESGSDAASGVAPALRTYAPLAARLVVGGIFLLAAIPKIEGPGMFADAVRAFHLLPPSAVLPFALILPWLEALVALYLLLGFMARFAGAAAAVLLAMFVYALGTSLISGNIAHSCGCFGQAEGNAIISLLAGGATIGWWDVIRDVILLGPAALVAVLGAGPLSVDTLLARRTRDSDS